MHTYRYTVIYMGYDQQLHTIVGDASSATLAGATDIALQGLPDNAYIAELHVIRL